MALINLPNKVVEVDPISRIEGHLGVRLTTGADGLVSEANVHGNLWRGFENFLIGRQANDAITFTQRICGVCPLPHATASTFAVESVLGVSDGYITFGNGGGSGKGVPTKAVHIRNLVYGSEFLMSHITHFYHLVAQSFVQGPAMPPWQPWFDDELYASQLRNPGGTTTVPRIGADLRLWDAVILQYVKALRIRRLTFEAGALFAGRMPMTSSFVAGGVSVEASSDLKSKAKIFHEIMSEIGTFILKEYVPLVLALGALYPDWDNENNHPGSPEYGKGCGNFLAWGAFPNPVDGSLAISGGTVKGVTSALKPATSWLCTGSSDAATARTAVAANLMEFIGFSHYGDALNEYDAADSAYPGDVTVTEPKRDTGYSWLKAPRWDGDPMEVGPLARLVVNNKYPMKSKLITAGGPFAAYLTAGGALDTGMIDGTLVTALSQEGGTLLTDVVNFITNIQGGISTMDRLRGRALESALIVQWLIGNYSKVTGKFGSVDAVTGVPNAGSGWIGDLAHATGATYRSINPPVGKVSGFGVSEAPRGALAHFITATAGKIDAYQCVVPTTWNASPKDNATANKRGPMEQAMMGIPYQINADAAKKGATYTDPAGATKVTSGGIEALRVAQSFDPCIACAVH